MSEGNMRRMWRRYRPVLVVIVAALGVGTVQLAAWYIAYQPPNWTRIEVGLYMGGRVGEPPPSTNAVLNLCRAEDNYRAEVHHWEPIVDGEPTPSLDWLRKQVAFIDEQRQAGRAVFVHCRNGVSRSGLVIVAYLMSHHEWSCDEALAFVRTRRPIVRPSLPLMGLLREWEQHLRKSDTSD
jgi:Dual specificity phosphatase, catalytic domain